MAYSIILAATTAGGNSADVVVTTASGPMTVGLFTSTGDINNRVRARIQVKTGSVYQPLYDGDLDAGHQVFLSQNNRELSLASPGTYRIVLPTTVDTVGVYKEDGS